MSKNKQLKNLNNTSEFLIYTAPSGKVKVEAFIHNENVWLTQDKIALLFDIDRSVVNQTY